MTRLTAVIALICLVALTGMALPGARAAETDAGEARKVFDSLYAGKVSAAMTTTDSADDLQLATKIVEDAKSIKGQDALRVLMYEAAAKLAQNAPTGYETAIAALQALVALAPDRAEQVNNDLIELLNRQYIRSRGDEKAAAGSQLLAALRQSARTSADKGDYVTAISTERRAQALANQMSSDDRDAIKNELNWLLHRQRVDKRVATLRSGIEAKPEDKSQADELARIYLVDLDDPASAATWTSFVGDAELLTILPHVGKPVSDVGKDDLLNVGQWYREQSKRSATIMESALLTRAQTYLKQYVQVADKGDLKAVAAELTLKDVTERLAKLDAPPTKPVLAKAGQYTGKPMTIEAEHAKVIVAPMQAERSNLASGGQYVVRPANGNNNNNDNNNGRPGPPGRGFPGRGFDRGFPGRGGPRTAPKEDGYIVFRIDALEAGDAYIWARVRTPDESNNSFYLAAAAGETTDGNFNTWYLGTHNTWTWVPYTPSRDSETPATITLAKGMNSIIIATREAGAMIDAIVIGKTLTKPPG